MKRKRKKKKREYMKASTFKLLLLFGGIGLGFVMGLLGSLALFKEIDWFLIIFSASAGLILSLIFIAFYTYET